MELPTDDRFSVPPHPETWRAPPKGRVICFAPHPDDEAAGPGGALCMHRDQGDPVRIVMGTDGIAGDPDGKYDPATYAERRRGESRAAMAKIDIEDFAFWALPDSCVITDGDIDMIAERAAAEIDAYRADVLYVPWEGEGNSDHRALYCGVVRALRRHLPGFGGVVLGYEIWNMMVPDAILDITAVFERKLDVMRSYPSQLAYVDYLRPVTGLNAQRSLIFNKGIGYGEAYRIVRWEPAPAR